MSSMVTVPVASLIRGQPFGGARLEQLGHTGQTVRDVTRRCHHRCGRCASSTACRAHRSTAPRRYPPPRRRPRVCRWPANGRSRTRRPDFALAGRTLRTRTFSIPLATRFVIASVVRSSPAAAMTVSPALTSRANVRVATDVSVLSTRTPSRAISTSMLRSVPQSVSRMMTSWETSTRRRSGSPSRRSAARCPPDLPGAVRGDEVLQHAQTLAEVA